MSDRQDFNRKVIDEFRGSRDRGEAPAAHLIILTTLGAKSGKLHTTPVRAFFDRDKPYVIASKGVRLPTRIGTGTC